jgi:isopentenyl diphosphate isomerase/L-lactate dehydrogenase-like FMN-dependent dehydrogenase
MKRLIMIGVSVLVAGNAGAQQYPILDKIAQHVVQKYQNSSCAQLMAQRDQPRSPEEQHAIQMLHDDAQMRHEFINRIAAPVANKMFECHMIP